MTKKNIMETNILRIGFGKLNIPLITDPVTPIEEAVFTFDSTEIIFDSTTRTFDETL